MYTQEGTWKLSNNFRANPSNLRGFAQLSVLLLDLILPGIEQSREGIEGAQSFQK